MPVRMWGAILRCPNCQTALCSKGLYTNVRQVIDISERYYLVAQYHYCPTCPNPEKPTSKATFIAYDRRLLEQLPTHQRDQFPIIMTYKYACDEKVVALMRSRTVGNSPTAVCHTVAEIHSEQWMRKASAYLGRCAAHKEEQKKKCLLVGLPYKETTYEELPKFEPLQGPKWFLAVYIFDVLSRSDLLKASATSVLGNIIKIDSTKKVTRKLQGKAQGCACWSTNVGNETGAVLLSLFTSSESNNNLDRAASGLMDRYESAQHPPPAVLYTDRDCCKEGGPSKYQRLFHKWSALIVRLDSWHFIRRLAKACVNESHPLYSVYMGLLSNAIFEVDPEDYKLLMRAKKEELQNSGIKEPADDLVRKSITKRELQLHCKRRTRGVVETNKQLEKIFNALAGKTDATNEPLFRDSFMEIWEEEKKHIECLQDPEGIQLYTQTGTLKKGYTDLPTYRCGRGTTGLESFHLHLNTFIPGKDIYNIWPFQI